MTNFLITRFGAACIVTAMISTPVLAGGLSDAIVESTPAAAAAAQPATRNAIPGWVIPAIAVLVIGGVAASASDSSNSGSGESGSSGPPSVGGVK